MSTTLMALNRLEQQRAHRTGTGVQRIHNGRNISENSLWSTFWHDRRHIVLISVCPVFIILGQLLVSALRTIPVPDGMAFRGQTTAIRYPIPRQPTASEVNHSNESGWQSITRSNGSIPGGKNASDDAGLIREPQDPIAQYYGDELKLHAIVWSGNPAARKAFINYRFVSQGHKVDDYFIAEISEQSIVLSNGHQLWRLILGR